LLPLRLDHLGVLLGCPPCRLYFEQAAAFSSAFFRSVMSRVTLEKP
jgi:hypothetical protein